MEGVQAYDCGAFHQECPQVDVVDNGGFLYLWCRTCRVLCNLQAVSPKFKSYRHPAIYLSKIQVEQAETLAESGKISENKSGKKPMKGGE